MRISTALIALALVGSVTLASANAWAGLVIYIGDSEQTAWEAAIGGVTAISGTEDFNLFTSDVPGDGTTIDLPLLTISAFADDSQWNRIDVSPDEQAQADQDGTPSFLGLKDVTFDFKQDLVAVGFGWLDNGIESQIYTLQVNFTDSSSSSFSIGVTTGPEFRGFVATEGALIDSLTWLPTSNYSPFSVDDIRLVAVPEPSTALLVGMGLVAMSASRRLRG